MSANRTDYIQYRIDKSEEIFDDAMLLADNCRWNSCVNRLYYCSFYIVTALLANSGVNAESHNGVKRQFNLLFVKTGIITKDQGKLFSNLFDWRQETDYADFIEFDEDTVQPLLAQVKNFIENIRQIILIPNLYTENTTKK